MAVPKTYLTSTKNLPDILTAIQTAQAPRQFSTTFLNNLGFKGNADRLVIGMLKALGFLTSTGAPTSRYFNYLDQTQGARVLAEALRESYSDLYELNVNAETLSRDEVKGKLKTLTQGQYSDDVLGKMATTFKEFASLADFAAVEAAEAPVDEIDSTKQDLPGGVGDRPLTKLGGLVYTINIQLPESRDPGVYDALFRSLRTHLFE
jgi:hypothetical protein